MLPLTLLGWKPANGMSLSTNITRARQLAQRRGLGATVVRAAEVTTELVYCTEVHRWLALDLSAERPHPTLPAGLAAERGGLGEVPLLKPFGYLREEVETQLDTGGELWLVRDSDALVFVCWLYPRRTPMRAGRDGWLDLPEGVVCLENVHTAPSHRGRGIAPAVFAQLADDHALRGTRAIVMKVATRNTPSLRAAEKAGFREIATMVYRRRGPVDRVRLTPLRATDLARQFAVRIER